MEAVTETLKLHEKLDDNLNWRVANKEISMYAICEGAEKDFPTVASFTKNLLSVFNSLRKRYQT